jgi:hypothetical protein
MRYFILAAAVVVAAASWLQSPDGRRMQRKMAETPAEVPRLYWKQ